LLYGASQHLTPAVDFKPGNRALSNGEIVR